MTTKNIECKKVRAVSGKEKRIHFVYLMLICCMFLPTRHVYSQSDSAATPAPVIAVKGEEENLNVFNQWITWHHAGNQVMNHLNRQAVTHYKARDEQIAKLKSSHDWDNRKRAVKDKLNEIMGPFPQKGPLNPVITGVIKGDGYRVEKIIFESMPGYYVTGCMFVPDRINGKLPAVLNVMGHDQEAFRQNYTRSL